MSGMFLDSMQLGGLTAQNHQLKHQLKSTEAGGTTRRQLTLADYDTAAASAQQAYKACKSNAEEKAKAEPNMATQQQEQSEQQNWQRQQLLDSLVGQLRSGQTKISSNS